jgi:hypothetical protein
MTANNVNNRLLLILYTQFDSIDLHIFTKTRPIQNTYLFNLHTTSGSSLIMASHQPLMAARIAVHACMHVYVHVYYASSSGGLYAGMLRLTCCMSVGASTPTVTDTTALFYIIIIQHAEYPCAQYRTYTIRLVIITAWHGI